MYQHSLVNRLRLASIAAIVGMGLVALMMFSLGGAGLLHVSAAPAGRSVIGDYVWYDADVDGDHIGTEAEFGTAGIDGVVINLYHDANGNSQIDPNEYMSTTTTGANPATSSGHGWYEFDVTADGNQYIVEIDDSNFVPGGPLEGMRLTSELVYGEEPSVVYLPRLVDENKDIDFGYVKVGVELVKVANNAPDGDTEYIYPGDPVVYTYVFTNIGDADLVDLTLTDDKASPSTVCTYAGPLAPGASHTCQYTATHVSSDITNTATVTGTPVYGPSSSSPGQPIPGGPVTDTDTAEVDVVNPGIAIDKTPDLQYLLAGETANFTITITNTGDTSLSPIVLDDPLSTACEPYGGPNPLPAGATYQFSCAQSNVTVDFTNVITVTGTPVDDNGDPLPDINPVTDTDDADVDVVDPSVAISKTPDLQYHLAGELAEFTITITNTGDITLTHLSLSDPLAPSCGPHTAPNPFAPGASASYTCTQTANDDFTNVITVTGTPSDENNDPLPGIDDVSDNDDAVVDVVHPSIVITKTPDIQYLNSGGTASFTITVHNTGDVRLYPVNVTDPSAANCDKGPLLMEAGDITTYTCFVSNVTADFTNVITATGTPVDTSNTPLPGIDDVSDSDDAVVDVMAPSIAISKVPFTTESVRQGETITFTIIITNTGEGWVDVLPLSDVYSTTYLSYQSASISSDDNIDDGEINWTDLLAGSVPPLAPGESTSLEVYFEAKKDTTQLMPDSKTENRAIVDGALVDPDGPNDPEGPILPIERKEDDARVQIIYPTGLEMAGANLFSLGRDVQINWNTANEANILGFNLYRGQRFDSMTIVNDRLIPANNPGMSAGAFYRFLDEGLSPGRYVYKLEVVRLDGSSYRIDLGLAFTLPARDKTH
jgi:uncharacterized repeat protein (TIGR01451 family)